MRKNIYIKDEDLGLYEEAERLAGDDNSLSNIIAEALKRYIAAEKAKEEIVLEVGRWPAKGTADTFKVAFNGRLLAEAVEYRGKTISRDDRGTDWAIYQTSKGKILIYWKDWSRWENEGDSADYVVLDNLPELHSTFVGDAGIDTSYNIPAGIIEEAAKALGQDPVKRLDI